MATSIPATPATPAKLRNGSWGARVQGAASVGDTLQITTRSGKTWQARVSAVLWSGDGVTLCATQSTDRSSSYGRSHSRSSGRRRGTWTGCACGSVEEYERSSDCASCRHDR